MTLQEAIGILSQAANGHAFTTGAEFYEACRLGIEALIQQREREDQGPRVRPLAPFTRP